MLLIQGPPGVGNTHVGVALGVKAIEHGFGVVFYRLDELLPVMRRDGEPPPSLLRRKKYINTGLLILDLCGARGYVELVTYGRFAVSDLEIPTPHN